MAMNKGKAPVVVMVGAPASGRTTQAERMAKLFNLRQFLLCLARRRHPPVPLLSALHPAFGSDPASYWRWLERKLNQAPRRVVVIDSPIGRRDDGRRLVDAAKKSGRPLRVVWLVIDESKSWQHLNDDRVIPWMERWDYYRLQIMPELQWLQSQSCVVEVQVAGAALRVTWRVWRAVKRSSQDGPSGS